MIPKGCGLIQAQALDYNLQVQRLMMGGVKAYLMGRTIAESLSGSVIKDGHYCCHLRIGHLGEIA